MDEAGTVCFVDGWLYNEPALVLRSISALGGFQDNYTHLESTERKYLLVDTERNGFVSLIRTTEKKKKNDRSSDH